MSPRFYREPDTPGLVGDPTDAINKTGWKQNIP